MFCLHDFSTNFVPVMQAFLILILQSDSVKIIDEKEEDLRIQWLLFTAQVAVRSRRGSTAMNKGCKVVNIREDGPV